MPRRHVAGQLGLFRPESSWRPPADLPDLRGRPVVALDTEARDDGLAHHRGPGWALGPSGYTCGVSWAAEGSSGYAPTRHPDTENLPHDAVMRWVADLVKSGTRVVFHNAPYDIGWVGCYGVPAPGPGQLEDTLAASVMLDETRGGGGYSLDACCAWAGVPGKDTALLADAVEAYGGDRRRPSADLWRVPARYAAPYATADAEATLALWHQLEPQLRAQEVHASYRTETDLVPMVVAMRRRGIRLDADRAAQVGATFRGRRDAALAEIARMMPQLRRAPTMDDVRSPRFMETLMAGEGIHFPRTEKTKQGSFSADWMAKHEHWLPRLVTQARRYEEAASKFVDTFLLGFAHRGRLHAEVHQFMSDEGGTRSHRFSYSDPPLQQMPSPDKDPCEDDPVRGKGKGPVILDRALGTLVRQCFLPEPGTYWLSSDFSQQEPRLTVHYAAACRVRGAEEAVRRYHDRPDTDYHQMVADMTGMPRARAKILNLAMTYGKGGASTAEELGLSLEEAKVIVADYHARLPFIKPLEDLCKRRAGDRGYIRLIDGARMHYNAWEGPYMTWEEKQEAVGRSKKLNPCSRAEAEERAADPDHPWSRARLRRADTRKALNNIIQGSAARQTKIAGLQMWREGILPLIQMHDEYGVPVASDAERRRVAEIMRDAIPLRVPVLVDADVGPSWGQAKLSWEACVAKYGPPEART